MKERTFSDDLELMAALRVLGGAVGQQARHEQAQEETEAGEDCGLSQSESQCDHEDRQCQGDHDCEGGGVQQSARGNGEALREQEGAQKQHKKEPECMAEEEEIGRAHV